MRPKPDIGDYSGSITNASLGVNYQMFDFEYVSGYDQGIARDE